MAGALGWSPEQIDREVEHYTARVRAERASQEQPDDETADAARLGAPEVVPLGRPARLTGGCPRRGARLAPGVLSRAFIGRDRM